MKKVSLKEAVKALGGYTAYAMRLVQIIKMYEPNLEKGTTTVEYQFKGQNASKLPIPSAVLAKLDLKIDDDGKIYLTVDNINVKILTENNWKRLVLVQEASSNEVD